MNTILDLVRDRISVLNDHLSLDNNGFDEIVSRSHCCNLEEEGSWLEYYEEREGWKEELKNLQKEYDLLVKVKVEE